MANIWIHALGVCIGCIGVYLPRCYLSGLERTAAGGIWVEFQKHWFWKTLARWLFNDCKVVVEEPEKLRACKQGILAAAPHGVVSFNHAIFMTDVAGWFSDKVWPVDRRDLAASVVFKVPGYRELLMWTGNVDASAAVARKVLNSGRSLFVYPGGEAEQMRAAPGRHVAFWKTRKGFVKLAVEFGLPLIPAYSFGENDMYLPSGFLLKQRLWLCDKAHVAVPLVFGRSWLAPLLPRKVSLVAVIGEPMAVPKVARDDANFDATVDKVHAEFCGRLVLLFDRHKAQYATADAVLEIIGGEERPKKD
ncbi:diacylglycerol acyltransferase [Pelagophyceae sp. CCMP2097]|nr:diacylglycerol acyltransferase [Pelagophyceae sp. CCMP2097]